jgi:hypothetical protein
MGLWCFKTLLDVDLCGEVNASIGVLVEDISDRALITNVALDEFESVGRLELGDVSVGAIRQVVESSYFVTSV